VEGCLGVPDFSSGAKPTYVGTMTAQSTPRRAPASLWILALIAEFENDVRRERQMDEIAKAKDRGVRFGRKRELTDDKVREIRKLRKAGQTVPSIIKVTASARPASTGRWDREWIE
jgi:DNA invertase Pin-like site-specific DNA recombinase